MQGVSIVDRLPVLPASSYQVWSVSQVSQRRNVATLIIRYLLSLLRSEVWEVHSYYIVSVKWKLGSRFIPFCERRRSHKKEAPFCGIGGMTKLNFFPVLFFLVFSRLLWGDKTEKVLGKVSFQFCHQRWWQKKRSILSSASRWQNRVPHDTSRYNTKHISMKVTSKCRKRRSWLIVAYLLPYPLSNLV